MSSICRAYIGSFLVLLTLLLTHISPIAHAHPLDITYTTVSIAESTINIQTNLTARQVRIAFLGTKDNIDGNDIFPLEKKIREYIEKNIVFSPPQSSCKVTSSSLTYDKKDATQLLLGGIQFKAIYTCEKISENLVVQNTLFNADFPDQRNIVVFSEQSDSTQHIFTPQDTVGTLEVSSKIFRFSGKSQTDESLLASLWRFIRLGFEHVLIGYDHIAFIIGIHLVVRNLRDILKIVTSFTIAHSITLTLATLGIIELPSAFVEAAIAATILYIGMENIIKKEWRRRWQITFGLGLIHGLGFSSVLREIGIPKQFLIPDLIGFNIGVEAGQLTIVAILVPLLLALSKRPKLNDAVIYVGSICISIAGLVWFLERVF